LKQVDLILKKSQYNFITQDYDIEEVGFSKVISNEYIVTLKDFIEKEPNLS